MLNTTRDDRRGLTAITRVLGLDGRERWTRTDRVDALANRATALAAVPLDRLFAESPMLVVSLRLTDAAGAVVSENSYWRGRDPAAYRALNALAPQPLDLRASAAVAEGVDRRITVTLANRGTVPALSAKLTLVDEQGARILPAYYSDNYLALMPGETKTVEVRYPANVTARPTLRLRGWNVPDAQGAAQ